MNSRTLGNSLVVTLSSVFLIACVSNVHTKQDLFADASYNLASEKGCYSYDTSSREHARNLPSAVGLGVIGGLFPPLMILTAVSSGALAVADQAALPAKCGLTVDDAVKEAWKVSFYEQDTAIWLQKDGSVGVSVQPLFKKDSKCSIHKISISTTVERVSSMKSESLRRVDDDKLDSRPKRSTKTFSQNVEICKSEEGEPYISSQDVTNEEVNKLKQLNIVVRSKSDDF